MAAYVLDTHALAWSVLEPVRLGQRARRVLGVAAPGEIIIPSAVIIELGRLIDEDKINLQGRLPSAVFGPALDYHGVAPTTLDAAIKARHLDLPHADPFDRLIVAEALVRRVPLITKDGNITDSGLVPIIW